MRRRPHQAEPEAVGANGGRVETATRRPAIPGEIVPTAAAIHAVRCPAVPGERAPEAAAINAARARSTDGVNNTLLLVQFFINKYIFIVRSGFVREAH